MTNMTEENNSISSTTRTTRTTNPFKEFGAFVTKKPVIKVAGSVFEFIGTFSLCFIGGLAAYLGGIYAALGHGLVLALFIYMGARYGSGVFNPAVSLGLVIGQALHPINALIYLISQILGSLLAGALLELIKSKNQQVHNSYPGFDNSKYDWYKAFAVEAIGTFFLMTSIYAVAVHHKQKREVCAIVIGSTLCMLIIGMGPLTGAGFNPIRTLGGSVFDGEIVDMFENSGWIYFVAPFIGAPLAVIFYKFGL